MNRSRSVSAAFGILLVTVAGYGTTTASEQANGGSDGMQRRIIELSERISGSATEREAVDYLSWRSWSDPVVACMKEKGFDYPLKFTSVWVGWTSSGPSPWLAEPGRRIVSEQTQRSTEQNRILDADPPPEPGTPQASEAYQHSVDLCAKKAGDALPTVAPNALKQLESQFRDAVNTLDERIADPDRYRDCMANQGIDLVADSDGWGAAYQYLAGELPASRLVPLPGEPSTPEWERFLDTEAKVVDADSTCRESTYREGLPQLADLVDRFTSDHAGELETLDVEWADVVRRAEQQGWSPQR